MAGLGAVRFDAGDLTMALLGAASGFVGFAILWIGAQAWRRRRPIVVPAGWAVPVASVFLLLEFTRRGSRRSSRDPREWGSGSDWLALAVIVVAVGAVVVFRLRKAGRRLYVGGLGVERGQQLARAALAAIVPDGKVFVDADGSIQRIAKEGPGLEVKEQSLFGVVIFKPVGDLPEATSAELFDGIARCLGAEELALRPALAARVLGVGLLFLAIGVAAAVVMATRDS